MILRRIKNKRKTVEEAPVYIEPLNSNHKVNHNNPPKNDYKEICNHLDEEISKRVKTRYPYECKVETKWKNYSLKASIFIDNQEFRLAEITSECGMCNEPLECISDIHIIVYKPFRKLGLSRLLMDYYKQIAIKEHCKYITLTVSPMYDEHVEYEKFKKCLKKYNSKVNIDDFVTLDKKDLVKLYTSFGFETKENYMVYKLQ